MITTVINLRQPLQVYCNFWNTSLPAQLLLSKPLLIFTFFPEMTMDGWIQSQTKLEEGGVVKRHVSDAPAFKQPILQKEPKKLLQTDSTTLMSLLKLMHFCGYLPIKWKKRNSVDSSKEPTKNATGHEQHFKASILFEP
jgi:hypothetical protein